MINKVLNRHGVMFHVEYAIVSAVVIAALFIVLVRSGAFKGELENYTEQTSSMYETKANQIFD
jgi:hypothetical protein